MSSTSGSPMDREKALNWPAKQNILIESEARHRAADQPVCEVCHRGPRLPEEYDREMARHGKALADGGVTVVDPWPLLLATTREDGYHIAEQ